MVAAGRPVPGRLGPSGRPGPSGSRVVALGGGHGLSASLRALRRLTGDITAIVGVADDGGSSGRLRAELGVIPPGDLRMALAALCGDDEWGRTWSRVMQHRFSGDGELAGHATGNLLISTLWQETDSIVEGLDWVAALLGVHGRVLPVATIPLDIVATVRGADRQDPDGVTEVRGQAAVAHTVGQVVDLKLEPDDAAACPEAVEALRTADVVVLGPGSWYTSVMPHLLVPGVRIALQDSQAKRLLVLNLDAQPGETTGFRSHTYLRVLAKRFPDLRLDWVLADDRHVDDVPLLRAGCAAVGAELVRRRMSVGAPGSELWSRHDPDLLAVALGAVLSRGSISPWQ